MSLYMQIFDITKGGVLLHLPLALVFHKIHRKSAIVSDEVKLPVAAGLLA